MRKPFAPFERFGIGAHRGGSAAPWSPAALFAAGEAGYAPDIADLATLFQDAVGTSPVTASGQAGGLLLDKSKGLVLGAEILPNGDFSGPLIGWSGDSPRSIVDGQLKVETVGYQIFRPPELVVEIGKFYQVTFSNLSTSNSNVTWRASYYASGAELGGGTIVPGQTVSTIIKATHVNLALWFQTSSPATKTIYFDNISVREIPGNHAAQPTAGSRPTYQVAAGLHWLADSGGKSLPATLPSLGTNATVWHATEGVTTILTGQTVSAGAFETLRGQKTYAVGAINRPLTGPETAALTAYLNAARGA